MGGRDFCNHPHDRCIAAAFASTPSCRVQLLGVHASSPLQLLPLPALLALLSSSLTTRVCLAGDQRHLIPIVQSRNFAYEGGLPFKHLSLSSIPSSSSHFCTLLFAPAFTPPSLLSLLPQPHPPPPLSCSLLHLPPGLAFTPLPHPASTYPPHDQLPSPPSTHHIPTHNILFTDQLSPLLCPTVLHPPAGSTIHDFGAILIVATSSRWLLDGDVLQGACA